MNNTADLSISSVGEWRIDNSNTFQVGDFTYHPWDWYRDYHWQYPQIVTHSYPVYEDRTKKALSIVKMLMEKKIIHPEKIKDFVEIVEKIAELI